MSRVRCVLLDALGTLLELERPWPLLRDELRARHGIEIPLAAAERALRAEMAYYRAHHDEGRDAASLAALRTRCAQVLRAALPPAARAPAADEIETAMMAALRFRPYPEVPAALAALRARGLRLVVVSNWDVSLHERLEQAGLAPLLDGAIASAEAGAAKPAPEIFARALALAGVGAGAALHVGDSVEADVAGARAAGIAAVLVARDGAPAGLPAGVPVVASLAELPALAALDRTGRPLRPV